MSSSKQILICPKCHQFYITDRDPQFLRCSDCHTSPLDLVDIAYEQYSAFSPEAKETFKREYVNSKYPDGMTVVHTPYEPIPDNGWASFLRIIGTIFILVGVCFGIFCFTSSILLGVLVIFLSFLSVAGIMLIASVADDIRAIRNSIDRYFHYHP